MFLLRPPNLLRRRPSLERENVCNSQETAVRTRYAAIVNHPAVLKILRVVNLLRVLFLVRRGPLGRGLPRHSSEKSPKAQLRLGCRKWECNKWGLKGCLVAPPGNQPKSAFFALFLPFIPFSGGSEEHLGNRENGGKRPFSSDILGYP